MAIGERIRFIRNLRGMTQKWLGQAVGFPQKTADIRMAQSETQRLPCESAENQRQITTENDKKPVPMISHQYGVFRFL